MTAGLSPEILQKLSPADTLFEERPHVVFWELTRACALACQHCRAEAQVRPALGELDTTQAKRVLEQLAAMKPYQLVLTGGDPLMRRDLPELIEYASSLGLNVALSPAATQRLLNQDFSQLKALGVGSMSLSLDGPDKASHDSFRGLPGTFTRTIAAVHQAHAADIRLQINTTLTRDTVHRYDEFRELVRELAPHRWSLFALVPTGRAEVDALPHPADVEALFKKIAQDDELAIPVGTTEAPHFRRVRLQLGQSLQRGPHPVPLGIRDGRGILFISHTGVVSPSGFLPVDCGNLKREALADIYRKHPLFRSLRDSDALKGKCGRCSFRRICGGSRARAFAMTGDPLGPDPLCPHQPKGLIS